VADAVPGHRHIGLQAGVAAHVGSPAQKFQWFNQNLNARESYLSCHLAIKHEEEHTHHKQFTQQAASCSPWL
jgi:hypothetical protein